MSIVYNNLCPICYAEQAQGVDISHKTARVRIYPEQEASPTILVCIHPEGSSILDLGECSSCRKTGVIAAPEDQRGVHSDRDLNFITLEIDVSGEVGACYCPDCNQIHNCEHCGEETRALFTKNVEGKDLKLCRSCYNSARTCTVCRDTVTWYSTKYDRHICVSCQKKHVFCPTCNTILRSKDMLREFGDTIGCPNCLVTNECAYCGEVTSTKYVSDTGYICGLHYPLVNNLPHVGGYHHTKVINFNKTPFEKNSNAFFGIENEVQLILSNLEPPRNLNIRRRQLVKEVQTIFSDCDCKHDGSLSYTFRGRQYNAGVEIVWQPMSWGWFKENKQSFKDMFAKITPMLRKNMTQAGMHIHISKEAFTPLHFLKFTNFFYMQEKADFLRVVAGRASNSYARISTAYSLDGKRNSVQYKGRALAYHEIAKKKGSEKLKYGKTYRAHSDRYDCINTTNSATYEVRIFKGARTFEEFIRRLQFTHSIYEYTRLVSRKDMSLPDYFKFVKKNVKDYPELTKLVCSFERKMNKVKS